MRLYLDEMISPAVASALRERGHDAVSTVDRDALGASDAAQLARAIHEGRALVTYNIADFAPLARTAMASGGGHPGIVFVSSRRFRPDDLGGLIRALDVFLGEHGAHDALRNRTVFLPAPES